MSKNKLPNEEEDDPLVNNLLNKELINLSILKPTLISNFNQKNPNISEEEIVIRVESLISQVSIDQETVLAQIRKLVSNSEPETPL